MLKSAAPIKLIPDEVLFVLVEEHCDIIDAVSLAQSCTAFRLLIGGRLASHVTSSYYPILSARGITEGRTDETHADTKVPSSNSATVHKIFCAIRSQRHTFAKLFQALLNRPFSVLPNNKSLLAAQCKNMARLREIYPPNNDWKNHMGENPMYALDDQLFRESVGYALNETSIFARDHENIYEAVTDMETKFPEIITSTLFDTMPARTVLTKFAQTNASQWITLDLAVFNIWFLDDFNKLLRHAHTVNEKYAVCEFPPMFLLETERNVEIAGTIFITMGDDMFIHAARDGTIIYYDVGCGSDQIPVQCHLEFNEFLSSFCEDVATLDLEDIAEHLYSPVYIRNSLV
ncbi:hypothetical protein HK100_002843 [Physocladia obscura]|uniref:Uncharacterized protein n=1 Tax=Physocladia obscura TaxID=109957 RepID=A0AAD5X9V1_9FUNG|nr:hypothetical protein HK100_002843 [Physocladia obscura]